jgi:alpha-glucosidase
MAPPKWWQTAVIYEVYPRSFADTSGDGIGDLPGITSRLDYLANTLGVDAIWVCPFYPSPMIDFGYDVADFTTVDPVYGTLADFDTLTREAHDRGIRVIIDYIPNHSSDQNPWFTESRSSKDHPKRDWYVWADPAPGGGLPSNWTSEMGGSVWQFDTTTGQYYLHSFHRRQPDLNWRSAALREAMLDVLAFWLGHGADGIRIDVAHLLAKHPKLADNPVRKKPRRNLTDRQHPDYDTQEHVNDRLQPEVHDYLAMMRRVLDDWSRRTGRDRIAMAEVEVLPWPTWSQFFGERDDGVHLPFNFQLIEAGWSPAALAASIEGQEAALPGGAWPNYVLQNHDRPRLATRLGPEHVRNAAMLLLTLRGTPTLYYGEELGLADLLADPGRWLDPLGRDESRAPMPWTAAPGGGFSPASSVASWLPPYPDPGTVSVEAQLGDPRSVLNLYRNLIACRREAPALLAGSYETTHAADGYLCYLRSTETQQVLVALNLATAPATIKLPRRGRLLLDTSVRRGQSLEARLDLPPHGGAIVELLPGERASHPSLEPNPSAATRQ